MAAIVNTFHTDFPEKEIVMRPKRPEGNGGRAIVPKNDFEGLAHAGHLAAPGTSHHGVMDLYQLPGQNPRTEEACQGDFLQGFASINLRPSPREHLLGGGQERFVDVLAGKFPASLRWQTISPSPA